MPVAGALLLTLLALLGAAVPAHAAGDPIMPLSEVRQGMQCRASSVLQGTTISEFGAEVVDVVEGDRAAEAPRILIRVSGDNIERTGVGPGFSGSPISCDGRVIGAISESVGEYGGLLVLATPIESILGEPVEPPPATSPAPRNTRSLAGPLSIGGLSPAVGRLFARAARREGRLLIAAPGAPRASAFPPQTLRPGASMAAGLSSGDVTAGAVGTVSYVDGDRVWAFGHPLDGTGRRSLFLQDSYVYAVVNNPIAIEGASTYKLAAPGHDVGILSGDGFSAVAGRTGGAPERFPQKVIAKDLDTGRLRVLNLQLADETALELPSGVSPLSLVGSAAVGQAAAVVLGASPSRQSGEMCVRITLRERRKPIRFCNRYVVRGGGFDGDFGIGVAGPMVGDFAEAVTHLDEYNFQTLHVTGVEVNLKVRRGLKQAYMLDAKGPSVVRRGRTVRVRVKIQEVRGRASWRTIKVPVPRNIRRGERLLTLSGPSADDAAGLEVDLGELLFGDPEGGGFDEAGPRTLKALVRRIEGIERYDGVRASFPSPEEDELEDLGLGSGSGGKRVYRDPAIRLSGTVQVPVRVK